MLRIVCCGAKRLGGESTGRFEKSLTHEGNQKASLLRDIEGSRIAEGVFDYREVLNERCFRVGSAQVLD